MKLALLAAAAILATTGCATPLAPPQPTFFDNLAALCGQAFEGRIASPPVATDAAFAGKRLVMHVRQCSPDKIRIPFHVGDDRSRTWVVTRTASGYRLKHDHRHEDGSEDVLTQYGGDTATEGTAQRQEFPVDQFSKDLFNRNDAAVSTTNVWAMEVVPKQLFAYELRRENRFFRVEFDLARPVPAPPPPWGATE
ncbi:MAG TPA: hypothetical protein VMN38_05100 [Sphingomicrobium sp.]|nr:hypothetical protein [Sphingomicrobium sp.]